MAGFVEHLNLSEEASYDLIKDAVNLARIACDRFFEEYPDNGEEATRKTGTHSRAYLRGRGNLSDELLCD